MHLHRTTARSPCHLEIARGWKHNATLHDMVGDEREQSNRGGAKLHGATAQALDTPLQHGVLKLLPCKVVALHEVLCRRDGLASLFGLALANAQYDVCDGATVSERVDASKVWRIYPSM